MRLFVRVRYTYFKNWDGRDFMGVHGFVIGPFFILEPKITTKKSWQKIRRNYLFPTLLKSYFWKKKREKTTGIIQELFNSKAVPCLSFKNKTLKNDRNYAGITQLPTELPPPA